MFSFQSKSKQISDLRQELDTLKREVRNLQLDWTDVEQRLRRRVASLARANQRADTLAVEGEDTPRTEEGNGVRSSLSPRAQLIQQQILDRRRRLQEKEGE